MKNLILIGTAIILASCSSSQVTSLNNGLNNFDTAVARIDDSIAKAAPKVAAKCEQAQSVGNDLVKLAPGSSTAASGLRGVNAGLQTWCQSVPTDTASAISALINIAAAGVEAYKQAKSGH